MNSQIRRLFLVVLIMFAALGLASTNIQFFQAPSLNADGRNSRSILHSAELDRGPIIVGGQAIASSEKVEDSARYQRTYSQGPLYAAVTGYFSLVSSNSTGIEKAAESELDGDSQSLLGQRIKNLLAGSSRQGGGVTLTLDSSMQEVAAESLGTRKGAVVALNAKTGAVLAMYSSPSYDPNSLASFDSTEVQNAEEALTEDASSPLTNRAIGGNRYAPGSTFKLLTTIDLLEKGVVTPDTEMDSPTSTTLPGTSTTVTNNESAACGSGKPTLAEAFARSCNTTFVIASQQLTQSDLSNVTSRFGFGSDLSIPLEVTPSVFPDTTDAAQLALAAIGQGSVQVTPLQMAMVAQTIANGGAEMKPYLIENVVDADLQVQSTTSPQKLATPISSTTASTMTDLMKGVVEQSYGTGTSMAISGIEVAAKTGTAELGDGSGKANAWAVGFAPADDPQIAFAVLVEGDDTTPVPHGGTEAGPIARALLEAGLK